MYVQWADIMYYLLNILDMQNNKTCNGIWSPEYYNCLLFVTEYQTWGHEHAKQGLFPVSSTSSAYKFHRLSPTYTSFRKVYNIAQWNWIPETMDANGFDVISLSWREAWNCSHDGM